jgi:RNase P/RNase MRP subunit p30
MNADFFIGKRNLDAEIYAKKLGFGKIYFAKEISALNEIKKEKDYDAMLIKTDSPELLRRMLDRASNLFPVILVLGTNDKINRIVLESKKRTILVSPEHDRKYDYIDRRNSGLNQVLCKIARDNNKAIIINFKDVLRTEAEKRAVLLGRIVQNIGLCGKYNVKLHMVNFASSEKGMISAFDIKSFCAALGMSTSQLKDVSVLQF